MQRSERQSRALGRFDFRPMHKDETPEAYAAYLQRKNNEKATLIAAANRRLGSK